MSDPQTSALDEGAAAGVKDCPFCGGAGKLISRDFTDMTTYSVQCVDCTAMVEGHLSETGIVGFVYEEDAVAAWNRRIR